MDNELKKIIEKTKELAELWSKYNESHFERISFWEVYKNNENFFGDFILPIGKYGASNVPIVSNLIDAIDLLVDGLSAVSKDEIYKNQENYYVDLYKDIMKTLAESFAIPRTLDFSSIKASVAYLNMDDAVRFYQHLVLNPEKNPDKDINPAESLYLILKWKDLFSENYIAFNTSTTEKTRYFIKMLLDYLKYSELEKKEMAYLLNKKGVPYKFESLGYIPGLNNLFIEESSFNQNNILIDQNDNYENASIANLSDTGSLINAKYKIPDSDYVDPLVYNYFNSNMGGSFRGGGGSLNIPLRYEIEIKGTENFEYLREAAEKTSDTIEKSSSVISSINSDMMKQFQQLSEEQQNAFSVDMSMLPLNLLGIGGTPFQFSMPVKQSEDFFKTLSDIADIAGKIGGAFMNVDENIGKAIGSAGGLAASISKIYSAVSADPLEGIDTKGMTQKQIEEAKKKGEKQNGLAIMAGIQGAFAGLQGLFGWEAGSDTSQLLGGLCAERKLC